jgi:hypothetical protein
VVVLEETLPPIAQTHHLEAMGGGPADDGANDRVEAGAVTPASKDGDFHEVAF